MKATILRFSMAVILLMALQTVKAQGVITEYFDVKDGVQINFKDKNLVKALYSKGVLDIDWSGDKRVLTISYDPKQTKMEDIMENINTVTGQNGIAMNNKTRELSTFKK
jgi:hypothetical protein